MSTTTKIAGFVCLLVGLAAGALGTYLVGRRGGESPPQQKAGREAENGDPPQPKAGREMEKGDPHQSDFMKSASSLLADVARGADAAGLSGVGPPRQQNRFDLLFDRHMARWHFVQNRTLTLDPSFLKPINEHLSKVEKGLTALAREKGVSLERRCDSWFAPRELSPPQNFETPEGGMLSISDAREGFRFHYSTGRAHGVVEVRMDYGGRRGRAGGRGEVAVYHYEGMVEEWCPSQPP